MGKASLLFPLIVTCYSLLLLLYCSLSCPFSVHSLPLTQFPRFIMLFIQIRNHMTKVLIGVAFCALITLASQSAAQPKPGDMIVRGTGSPEVNGLYQPWKAPGPNWWLKENDNDYSIHYFPLDGQWHIRSSKVLGTQLLYSTPADPKGKGGPFMDRLTGQWEKIYGRIRLKKKTMTVTLV